MATGVPMQVSATSGENRRLELHVSGLEPSDGPNSLHISWPDFRADNSDASKYGRYIFGGGALVIVLGFSFMAVRRQRDLGRAGPLA